MRRRAISAALPLLLLALAGAAAPAAAQAAAVRAVQVSARLEIPSRVRLREVGPLRALPAPADSSAWSVTVAVSANTRWELAWRTDSERVVIRDGGPCDDLEVQVAIRGVRPAAGRVLPAVRLELTAVP